MLENTRCVSEGNCRRILWLLILSHITTAAFKFHKIHKQQKFSRFIDFYWYILLLCFPHTHTNAFYVLYIEFSVSWQFISCSLSDTLPSNKVKLPWRGLQKLLQKGLFLTWWLMKDWNQEEQCVCACSHIIWSEWWSYCYTVQWPSPEGPFLQNQGAQRAKWQKHGCCGILDPKHVVWS